MSRPRAAPGGALRNRVFVAAATLLLAGVVSVLLAARPERRSSVALPGLGDRDARIGACDDSGVWLAAGTRLDGRRAAEVGVAEAMAERRAFVLRVGAGGIVSDTAFGTGSIASLSAVGGLVQALIVERRSFQGRSRIVSTTDGGASWSQGEAPGGAVGLAFASRTLGYVWTRSRVYQTQDGGRHWRSVEVEGPKGACRRMGCGNIAPDGSLWVPLEQDAQAEAADPSASILVVRPDLSLLTLSPFQPDVIPAVAIGDGQAPSAVVERLGRSGIRVERLPGASATRATLRTSDYSAEALLSRGEVLLVHEVTFDPKAHFRSNPGQRAAVSPDRGKSWTTIDLTDERAGTVCLSDGGFWVLSAPPDVRLLFHPLRAK